MNGGKLIVLTAPLTESIDHAGYFIQMSMASLPIWLEGILNKKYPKWRDVERNGDGSARYMPAGLRVLEAALLRAFDPDDIAVCYPEDVDQFIGPDTRVVAISTHNPLGVTFAAGVYASIFGSNRLADQLALRARDVRAGEGQSRSASSSRSSSAGPAAGRFPRPTPGTT